MPKPPKKPPEANPDPEQEAASSRPSEHRGRQGRAIPSAEPIDPERLAEWDELFQEFGDRSREVGYAYQRSLDQLRRAVESITSSPVLSRAAQDTVLKQLCLRLPPELTPQYHGLAPGLQKGQPNLPEKALLLWKDGREITLHRASGGERKHVRNPIQFLRATYGRWIGRGLTRRHINMLDPDLYRALSVWEHRHPEDRITDLPTLAEEIDARIAALAHEFSPDELRKLGSTLQTRHRRSKN
jgi:hypothetical protein